MKQFLSRILLACSLIVLTGCVVWPTTYYRPSGAGERYARGQFEHWCADKFSGSAAQGIGYGVQVIPAGRDTIVKVSFVVDKSLGWFQLSTDELILKDSASGEVRAAKFMELTKAYCLAGEAVCAESKPAQARIENPRGIPYEVEIRIRNFQPRACVLTLPAVTTEDGTTALPPVALTLKKGVRLYNLGQ